MLACQACLSQDWTSPVYTFFEPTPEIKYIDKRKSHLLKCLAKGCNKTVRRFLDKANAKSMGNLWKHVKLCWGAEVIAEADRAKNAAEAREGVVKTFQRSGTITAAF